MRRAEIGRVALALVTAVAAGDTLHMLSHRFRIPLGHHVYHLVFTAAAAAIFAVYVVWDVLRRGWPGLSWRL